MTIDPYTLVRKSRMLTEWLYKTFWPTCDVCGEEFRFNDAVETMPCLPVVDLKHGVMTHRNCKSVTEGRLTTSSTPVRIVAYRAFLQAAFELHAARCWYCREQIRPAELTGDLKLTLHHIDEDRGDSRLRGANGNAELELIHTRCHKAHHAAAPRDDPNTRLNGQRSTRSRGWRFHK